uniref:NADH dehydrogenase subunit 4L n=1 Tax=Apocheima cinerarius TaxID=706528 RepID=A0A125QW91_APOCI|nr:NADH dehydrogenase subunit 4L [Apocheima cinerarius]
MKYMYIIVIFMFIIGNLIFVSKYKHLLIILLSLEFMVLSVFFFLLMYLLMLNLWNMYINSFFGFFGLGGGFSAFYFSFFNSYPGKWLF